MSRARPRSTREIFAIPLGIAVASLVGLVAALMGDGPPDWLAWATLALPVAAVWWSLRHRRC